MISLCSNQKIHHLDKYLHFFTVKENPQRTTIYLFALNKQVTSGGTMIIYLHEIHKRVTNEKQSFLFCYAMGHTSSENFSRLLFLPTNFLCFMQKYYNFVNEVTQM